MKRKQGSVDPPLKTGQGGAKKRVVSTGAAELLFVGSVWCRLFVAVVVSHVHLCESVAVLIPGLIIIFSFFSSLSDPVFATQAPSKRRKGVALKVGAWEKDGECVVTIAVTATGLLAMNLVAIVSFNATISDR